MGRPITFRSAPSRDCRCFGSTPCFAAGTLVVTGIDSAGHLTTKNIEDVQVGDWVLTRSQDDPAGPLAQRQVTAVEVHTVTSLRLLDIQEADGTTETIRTTDEHPFWVSDVGWVKAGDLQVGQELVTSDGRVATVTGTRVQEHSDGIAVYNFTVDGDHTYFVTDVADDQAVWVHNAAMDTVGNPFSPNAPRPGDPGAPTKPAVPSREHLYDPITDPSPTIDALMRLNQMLDPWPRSIHDISMEHAYLHAAMDKPINDSIVDLKGLYDSLKTSIDNTPDPFDPKTPFLDRLQGFFMFGGYMEGVKVGREVPGWRQYEQRNGGQQTPMRTIFEGKEITVRLDKPPAGATIIDFKDYNWSNPTYQESFIQQRVIDEFKTQIAKYQTIRPNVHLQFSQEPPAWVVRAIEDAGGTYSVVP